MSARLVVEGLSKAYGDHVALRDVDLSVDEGRIVAVVGHNGAGKTTLLRVAAGLLDPTDGTVEVDGNEAGSLAARSITSFIPDAPVLYDDLSLDEQIEYVARLHGTEGWRERGARLVGLVGLTGRSGDLPARYSRGMRQKASIVLGLVRPFGLLLVDEPFVGLDAAGRTALVDLLRIAASDGAAVVVSTHQPEFLRAADTCVLLEDGRIASVGPASEVALGDGFAPDEEDDGG